ncbi:hypothetical protein N7534_007732 [Penicillium rubens]|nr:hypothetical protein N7534_007732 [Penicillium rubens]
MDTPEEQARQRRGRSSRAASSKRSSAIQTPFRPPLRPESSTSSSTSSIPIIPGLALLEQESTLASQETLVVSHGIDPQLLDIPTPLPQENNLPTPDSNGHTREAISIQNQTPTEEPLSPTVTTQATSRPRRAYNRRIPYSEALGFEENELPARLAYDQRLKWHFICNFNIENIEPVILESYPNITIPSAQWTSALNLAKDNVKNWKTTTLKKMKERVAYIMNKSAEEDVMPITDCDDEEKLSQYFYKTFNEEDFYYCFSWVYDILDLQKSSEQGRSFIRSFIFGRLIKSGDIWANLATKVKIWTDCIRSTGHKHLMAAGKMNEIHTFWYNMAKHHSLQGATKEIFAERPPRITRAKRIAPTDTVPQIYFRGPPIRDSDAS